MRAIGFDFSKILNIFVENMKIRKIWAIAPKSMQNSPKLQKISRNSRIRSSDNPNPFCTCHSSGNLVDGLPLAIHSNSAGKTPERINRDAFHRFRLFGIFEHPVRKSNFLRYLPEYIPEHIHNISHTHDAPQRRGYVKLEQKILLNVPLQRKPG